MPTAISLNCPTCKKIRTLHFDFAAQAITASCQACNPVTGHRWPDYHATTGTGTH